MAKVSHCCHIFYHWWRHFIIVGEVSSSGGKVFIIVQDIFPIVSQAFVIVGEVFIIVGAVSIIV